LGRTVSKTPTLSQPVRLPFGFWVIEEQHAAGRGRMPPGVLFSCRLLSNHLVADHPLRKGMGFDVKIPNRASVVGQRNVWDDRTGLQSEQTAPYVSGKNIVREPGEMHLEC
jgi:hypothetical protein